MSLLCLDLGTRTGYAIHANGAIMSGVAKFETDRYSGGGMRYLRFSQWLDEIHAKAGLTEVAFEEVRRHAGTSASHVYGGFLATLTSWCEANKVPYQGYPVGTIKKAATGKGNAPKDAMVAAAKRWGYAAEIEDDNHADALALMRLKLHELND